MIRRPKQSDSVITQGQAATAPSLRPILCPTCKNLAAPAILPDGRHVLLCGRCKAQYVTSPL